MGGKLNFRVLLVAAGCFAFGVLMAVFKGSTYNLRDVLGDLSAPWALLPFWASLLTARGRVVRGMLLGTIFVELAFLGFYLTESAVFDMSVVQTLLAGRIWSSTGLVAGPFFGGLGAVEGRSRRGRLWLVMSILFVLEPFAWTGYFYAAGLPVHYGQLELLGYGTEVLLGLVGCAVVGCKLGLFNRPQSPNP